MTRFQTRRTSILLAVLGLWLGTARAGEPVDKSPDHPTTAVVAGGRLVMDLEGTVHRLGGPTRRAPCALVFLGTECPISNRLVPELNRLSEVASGKDIDFYGVISDPAVSRKEARAHAAAYEIAFPVLFDASGDLARWLGPTHVPEAFVFGREGTLVYRGRVNDLFVELGKPRKTGATSNDLARALDAVASGRAVEEPRTEPVGCFFEFWKDGEGTGAVTYARDVAPILNAKCVACHREGEVAPFALTSYRDAARRAKLIASVVEDRYMPPWKPVPGFGEFRDEVRLGDAEIERIGAWARSGAPEGDPEDLPPPPRFTEQWVLGEPDLILQMEEPFQVPAEGEDLYQCFVIPSSLVENKVVVGFQYCPGAPAVVHHALLYVDTEGRGRRLDAETEEPGYPRFGGIGFEPSGMLGGYAPGARPHRLPEGTGKPLVKGSDIILQVHYHPSGKVESDRGSIALYFARERVRKAVHDLFLFTPAIEIPAGESHYEKSFEFSLPVAITLTGIVPHMHYLGRRMSVSAIGPSGEAIALVRVDDWDFRWQGQYTYTNPVRLEKGSRIRVEAVYDNSAENPFNPHDPPRRVTYGEATTDEMCLILVSLMTDDYFDWPVLRQAQRELLAREWEKRR